MQRLVELGLPVAHPRDIGTELDKLRDSYDERVAQFFVQVGNEIAALESQLAQMRVDMESRIQAKSATLTQQMAQTDLRISQLQAEHGFFRRLLNRGRVKLAQHQRRSIQAEFNKFCVSLNNAIATVENRAEDMKESKSHIVEQRKSSLDLTIARLENILTSKELAGAQAEVEVVEFLAKLPAQCYVFNDVRLEADNFMRFEGVPLQSAQADHVVLTPQAVFVIEVKNWSREFVEDRDYFDPYTQVGRARFLCQVLLRERGHHTKVRSIIATKGKLPGKREDQYVKVLSPRELNGYIMWFKDPPMPQEEIAEIRDFLERRVGQF